MSPLPQIILGIPGPWADRSEITTAIVRHSGGYLFAGMVLMHVETKAMCRVDVAGPDPRLRDAFEIAGGGRLSPQELDAIAKHRHTIYLIGDGGSFDQARTMMRAANALLRCGGLAVKVESAGIAHSAERWNELTESAAPEAILDALVTYIGQPGEFSSCGMHNVGVRDAVVRAPISPVEAADLLHTFLHYIAVETPTVHDGETFSVASDAPRYRMTREDQTDTAPDDPFHNPYGVWRLAPAG